MDIRQTLRRRGDGTTLSVVLHLGGFLILCALSPRPALAWFDATHMAVVQAAGAPYSPCVAIVPDAMGSKAPHEAFNHWHNGREEVTSAIVLAQVSRYNKTDPDGHLYGAIIAAYREVRAAIHQGKRPVYLYGFLAHYIGDLSQPLHNTPHDAFNQSHHLAFDGMVDDMPDLAQRVQERMKEVVVHGEEDLVREVVRLANTTRVLDEQARRRGSMTRDEALTQVAYSAALLRAVNVDLGIGR